MFISCKKLKIHLLYLLIILVKIEMTRQTDNVYRLDHAVTAKQKKILKAFGMNEGNITYRAGEISNTLRRFERRKNQRVKGSS